MKFICIDDEAVQELVSGRVYQSIDFTEGEELITGFLQGSSAQLIKQIGKIIVLHSSDRIFLSTAGHWKNKKFLILDCEQSQLFKSGSKSDSLNTFQKLLRLCVKYWNGGGQFSSCEHPVENSSKMVLFPKPFSSSAFGSGFRVVIETEPDKKRLKARDMNSHFMFVYKTGESRWDYENDSIDYQNLRKAFEELPSVYADIETKIETFKKKELPQGLGETNLSKFDSQLDSLTFDTWRQYLTNSQLEFLHSSHQVPHKLKGPAGSGKTLCLLLKTIILLRNAVSEEKPFRALFITHSEATRSNIINMLSVLDFDVFTCNYEGTSAVSLSVETLASTCANVLKTEISDVEFIDRDAQDSKLLQLFYIEEAIEDTKEEAYTSHRPFLSEDLKDFFENQPSTVQAELLQHEISVMIKGRSDENYDEYKNLTALKYGLPIKTEADKGLVYEIFNRYQGKLELLNQYDTDDVVLSAVGQLNTPIWRRRRQREGFDFIAVDETHLFNINELHIIHHFSKDIGVFPISFTLDMSQSVGDRGWEDEDISQLFEISDTSSSSVGVSTVFRCSPEILSLCECILASGATLFSHFENSMKDAQSSFTLEQEKRCISPVYKTFLCDSEMIEECLKRAQELVSETGSKKSEILITSLSGDLINSLTEHVNQNNKPVTVLDKRGDYSKIERAEKSGHFVVGHSDYVGGLEFACVIILGVDKGRVPFESMSKNKASLNFAKYSAHNRLYVATSRCQYALELWGEKSRGHSELLEPAFRRKLLKNVP